MEIPYHEHRFDIPTPSVDDLKSLISSSSVVTPESLGWVFDYLGTPITPEKFGAVGDGENGETDDTAALAAMFAAAKPGTTINLRAGKTYLTGSLTIPSGLKWTGGGVIKGKTSGSRPTRATLTGATDAAARSALLTGYYQTIITHSGSLIDGIVAFDSVLHKGQTNGALKDGSVLRMTNCAADGMTWKSERNSIIQAPQILITNASGDIGLQALYGGCVDAPGAIITHCLRGLRIINGGSINFEGGEIWSVTQQATFILFNGSMTLKNCVIDGCTVGAIVNNYGGFFNAEGATIRNVTSGVAIIIESNGSCYAYRASVSYCENGLGVALGGFIQAREMTFSNIGFVVMNGLDDGYIEAEDITVDPTTCPGVAGKRFVATGAASILIPAIDTGGLAGLTSATCNPPFNTVGRGKAFIGPFDGSNAAAQFGAVSATSLALTTDLAITDGGTGASSQLAAMGMLGLQKQISLADDAVYVIALPATVTAGLIMLSHNSATVGAGLYRWRSAASPFVRSVAADGTISLGTTALTNGTTDGVDGSLNLAVDDIGKIYIKNRTGSSLTMYVGLFQGAQNFSFLS